MKPLSNLPPGVTDSMIPGDTPEDQIFEDWIERNHEVLLEEFLSTHENVHKDNFDIDGRWDEFLNKKYDEEVV